MSRLLRWALRNLGRRRGRTALTTSMLFFGTTLIVWSVDLAEGNYATIIELITGAHTGHMQVLAEGYHERPSLHKTLKDPAILLRQLRDMEGVAAASARVETAGLISMGERTTAAQVFGVDGAAERGISTAPTWVKKGRWLDRQPEASSEDEVVAIDTVIGVGVARRLKAQLGDVISFVGQAADGSIAAELLRVVGLAESGAEELDAAMIFVPLADAQALLSLGHRVHRVVVAVKDSTELGEIRDAIKPPPGAVASTWDELMPEVSNGIKADRKGLYVFLVIMLMMVLLGVTNTMLMAVFERQREFGVLLALGTPPGQLVTLVVLEGFWLAFIGVVLGTIAGNLLAIGVPLPMGEHGLEVHGVLITEIRGRLVPGGLFHFPVAIAITAIFAALLAALRIVRISPAEAIGKGME